MKKFFMSVALVAAIAAGYMMTSSNESEVNVNDLTQANVEALAQSIDIGVICANVDSGLCGYFPEDIWVPGVPVYIPPMQ